jgi:hypothetical protein
VLGAEGNQIADYEPVYYSYREPDGAVVQPVWSEQKGKFIVDDGTSREFDLGGIWQGTTFTDQYELTINGDQAKHINDRVRVAVINGNRIKVTLDGQVAEFDAGTIAGITINPGAGTNAIRIVGVPRSVPVSIEGGGGRDAIVVGATGHAQMDEGDVSVATAGGITVLEVDDSRDMATPTQVTLGADSVDGIAGGTVTFDDGVKRLILRAAKGDGIVVSSPPVASFVTFNGRKVYRAPK